MKLFFTFTIVISIINSAFSQNYLFDSIVHSKSSIINKSEKVNTFIRELDSNDSVYHYSNLYSKWLFNNNKVELAIENSKYLLDLNLKLNDTIKTHEINYQLAKYFRKNGDYDKSISSLNKCIDTSNDKDIIKYYYQIALNYYDLNDIVNAQKYFLITIQKLKQKPNNLLSLKCYYNLSDINNYRKNHQKAIEYGLKSDSLSKYTSISNETQFLLKKTIGNYFNEESVLDINKASHYYSQALKIASKINDTKKINSVNILLGNLYNTTNSNKSISYLDKVFPRKNDSLLISDLAFNYALTYRFLSNYKNSIYNFEKSTKYLVNKIFNKNKDNHQVLINSNHKIRLLHILPILANTYLDYYKKTKNNNYLIKSIFYYKLSDNLIDIIKLNSSQLKSRLFWREKSESIYNKAIEASFLSKNINDAFYFMEKNKVLLLMEDISYKQSKIRLNTPKSLLKKENNIKLKIINLKHKTRNSQKIIDLERKLSLFQDSIYEKKIIANTEIEILSLKKVQKKIAFDEIIIEYHISKKNGYLMIISKNKIHFLKINNFIDLNKKLIFLFKSIKQPFNTQTEVTNFKKVSSNVFNQLFPIKSLLKSNSKIIIVPHKSLNYLPFEILINPDDNDYLLRSNIINYTYSISFSHNNNNFNRNPKKQLLGIAPMQLNYGSLIKLPKTKQEILNIKNIFNGTILLNEHASKQNFIRESNDYNIIHLATHADAKTTDTPWIAFKNNKLFLDELFTIKTQADLVVLSACNTTIGEIAKGEGVLSLARGFFYTGANTVVSSLWNVNDKATTIIMTNFYKNLKNGQSKSKALQQAKNNYIENHSLSETSPYYWASFVLIGDSGKLHQLPINNNSYLIFIIIGFISIILFIIYSSLHFKVKIKN